MGDSNRLANLAHIIAMDKDWIIEQLKQTGKSQSDLARFLDVLPSTVNKMVKGRRQIKSPEADEIRVFFGAIRPNNGVVTSGSTKDVRSAAQSPTMGEVSLWPLDVPVYGNVRGAPSAGGDVVFIADTGLKVRRPPRLVNRVDIFAVYVESTAMEPRYYTGELIYLEKVRPALVGDYVVVEMKPDSGMVGPILRQLTGRPDGKLKLRQFNPVLEDDIEIDLELVSQVLRVMSLQDLLA